MEIQIGLLQLALAVGLLITSICSCLVAVGWFLGREIGKLTSTVDGIIARFDLLNTSLAKLDAEKQDKSVCNVLHGKDE